MERDQRYPYGEKTVIKTSWMTLNPGRKFWSCDNQSCNRTFEWVEDDIPERARRIISGLLTSRSRLELVLKKIKKKEKYLWVCVIVLAIVIIFKKESGLC